MHPKSVEYKDQALTRTTIKLSNGAEESVFMPEGAKATKITLWSYTNVSTANRTSYWANVAGVPYTEENSVILAPTKTPRIRTRYRLTLLTLLMS